tara:strand:- start:14 stop:604 length:591 start_codon:yes stop_codon:yes gene_type:complete
MSENNPTKEAEAFVDFAAKYNKEREAKKNAFKKELPLWCKFFTENGIAQVLCEYEGSGDSGCIDAIYFFKEYNEDRSRGYGHAADDDELPKDEVDKIKLPDALKRETWIPQEEGPAKWGIPEKDQTVYDAYDYWASEALPDGFEINDGGFGTLDLNVKGGRMVVEANTRVTHYETETYEFNKAEDVDGTPLTSRDK